TCPKPSTTPWSARMWLAATRSSISAETSGIEFDVHVFQLRRVHQLFDRFFAPDSGLLVPAERSREIMRARRIDPYVACFDQRGGPMRGCQVARPDRSGKPVINVVDRAQHRRLVGPSKHAQHRPEDLLPGDPHIRRHVSENRGFDEETLAEMRILRRLAARDQARAVLCSVSDIAHYLVELFLADETTHRGALLGRDAGLDR